MAEKQNGPRVPTQEPSPNIPTTTSEVTRCRKVEVVDADMVQGPCDECADCHERGSYQADHWMICSVRLAGLRRNLAEALAGGDQRG